jgi:hypothetical protein
MIEALKGRLQFEWLTKITGLSLTHDSGTHRMIRMNIAVAQ